MLSLLCAPLAATLLATGHPVHGAPIEAGASVQPLAIPAAALVAKPELCLGERRSVVVQFQAEAADWNPFLTRFDPGAFRCFRVWDDEQLLWIREEYDAPAARFFALEGSAVARTLARAKAHDRLELEVVVREFTAGRAWIEVLSARWTEQQTPEGTVLHAIRALDLIEREGWTLAASELERALRPDVPDHVRESLAEHLE
ncbi:MAG: hypothetical protein AAGB93_25530, partial [Planctomycetota bacterium]